MTPALPTVPLVSDSTVPHTYTHTHTYTGDSNAAYSFLVSDGVVPTYIHKYIHTYLHTQVTPTLPTVSLVSDGVVLKEVSKFNPVIRNIKFTPNAVDVRRTYQQCFIALNPNLAFLPTTQVRV